MPALLATAPEYAEAEVKHGFQIEPHEMPTKELARIVLKVVETEWPIHEDEVSRRVARIFSKDRAGSRIAESVLKALRYCRQSKTASNDGHFWSPEEKTREIIVRNRARSSLSIRKADMIAPAEIREAIRMCEEANGPMSPTEATVAVTRILGFERAGPDLKEVINKVYEILKSVS